MILSETCPSYIVSFYSLQAVYFYFNILYIFRVQFLPPLTLLEKAVKQLPSGVVQCCHLLAVIRVTPAKRRKPCVPSTILRPLSKHRLTPQRLYSFTHLS